MKAPVYPVPDAHDDPRFRWLFEYWCERRGQGGLPGRDAIDPLDFPHLLGLVNLVDVERDGTALDYRFRLWGSRVTEVFGADHTGKRLGEIAAPGTLDALRNRFDQCVATAQPLFVRREISLASPEVITTSRLLLPLARDGVTVDMLLGLILADPR